MAIYNIIGSPVNSLINDVESVIRRFKGIITEWTVEDGDLVIELFGGYNEGGSIPPGTQPYDYNYDVDWGDGTSESGITTLTKSHTYPSAGTYTVKISGQFGGFDANNTTTINKNKLVSIRQWGTETEIQGLENAFNGCTNLVYLAVDTPIVNYKYPDKYAARLFYNCDSTKRLDLSGWNIYNMDIKDIYRGIMECDYLEYLNISGWDFSKINTTNSGTLSGVYNLTTYAGYFSVGGCELIMDNIILPPPQPGVIRPFALGNNQKLKSISVKNWHFEPTYTDISNIMDAINGNTGHAPYPDPLPVLDVSSWTGTSNFQTMYSSFYHCRFSEMNFTNWDFSNVTDMDFCFDGRSDWANECNFIFPEDLSLTNLVTARDMFRYRILDNYDWFLIRFASTWNTALTPTNEFDGGYSKYTTVEATRGQPTSIVAGKLIDDTQNFTSTVNVGDIILQTNSSYTVQIQQLARVTAIDDDHTLSISGTSFTSTSRWYIIQNNESAKSRYHLAENGWTIIDSGTDI